jgi:thioredoxin 1
MTIIIRKLSRPNCRPCAAIANYIAEIEPQLAELGATVSEHDVMAEPELIDKYGITGVPVLVYERNGIEVARLNGLVSPQEIIDALEHAKEAR